MELSKRFEDVSTVISILPILLREQKPGLVPGEFIIKPVKDPYTECSTLLVGRARFPVYIDENRPSIIVPEPSDRVCQAICRDYRTSVSQFVPDVAEPGLFWVPGEYSSARAEKELVEELTEARRLQTGWFKKLVEHADDQWEKYKTRKLLTSMDKMACRFLNLEREWNLDIEVEANAQLLTSTCKFCYGAVHPQAMVCPSCSGILDMARYDKEFKKVS